MPPELPQVSAKTEYACIALMDLAEHRSSKKVSVRDISERHLVSAKFLVHILLQLKKAGLVDSSRGAAGGFVLKKKPDEITLGNVVNAVAAPQKQKPRQILRDNLQQENAVFFYKNVLQNVWKEAEKQRQQFFDSITIADLLQKADSFQKE
ncbi:hypothetical protein FACS189427_12940 [Planctomycetales bacterium]|nr:hypothetical protein FACS189427_12940 [Planctomycetales bacterium]